MTDQQDPAPPEGFRLMTGRGPFSTRNGPFYVRRLEGGVAQAFFAGLDFCLIRSTAAPLLPPVTSPPARSVPPDEETIYVLN